MLLFLSACGLTETLMDVVDPTHDAPEPEAVLTQHVEPPPVRHKTVITDQYRIDKKYKSMRGPDSRVDVFLLDVPEPELLWITGYRTTVIDAKSQEKISQEFMCHANLDFDVEKYYDDIPTSVPLSGRVFTLSQGQQDIAFPPGTGIPILSSRPLSLTTQVLNLNLPDPKLDVRYEVVIDYVRDKELKAPMLPLFQSAVEGFKAIEDAHYYGLAQSDADPETHGPGCSVGFPALEGDFDEDRLGQKFTAHWVVPPGREVNRTNVTRFLNQPFDTTVHYIAVHLHPFAVSLELIDLTAGKSIFKSKVRPADGRVGIEHVEYYSSLEGMVIEEGHEYELISVYENTSDEPADSMAVMYMYMHDKSFEKPTL